MSEITKITTPMIPKENLGNKRPITEQAFESRDPTKVHKSTQDRNVQDREAGGQALREALGRTAVAPLLRGTNDAIQQIQKLVAMLQMGISTSEIITTDPMRELLHSLFVPSDQLLDVLLEQDEAGILFKGEAFDILRDILVKFPDNAAIRDAITNLLKSFEHNVNFDNSVKTILYQCDNLLDYMFSQDRAQFGEYLSNLADMLLPEHGVSLETLEQAGLLDQDGFPILNGIPLRNQDGSIVQQDALVWDEDGLLVPGQEQQKEGIPPKDSQLDPSSQEQISASSNEQVGASSRQDSGNIRHPVTGQPLTEKEVALLEQFRQEDRPLYNDNRLGVSPGEAASVLKNNLLPLLGEVVVKYYQSQSIRDLVMVVVHNIVRVDKGTPSALKEAVNRLVDSLLRVANLNENFGTNLNESLTRSATKAKFAQNQVMEKLSAVISQTLRNPESTPVALRQSENLLLSLLQNQSSMMNVLHFVLPLETPYGPAYAELYLDPDSEERPRGGGEEESLARKIFLSAESDSTGSMEMCFLEAGDRVEFSLWCADGLVDPLRRIKRPLADLMLVHGYTLTGFAVDELVHHHSIVQVFPKLLDRKVGIDVRI